MVRLNRLARPVNIIQTFATGKTTMMRKLGSATTRRLFLASALGLGLSAFAVGCGGESPNAGGEVKADPAQEQQVQDMTKFYENNPPGGAPAKK
jgi:hypothetical protein